MAGEIQSVGPTGATLYAVVRDPNGQLWYTTTPAFEAFNAAHWTAYSVAMVEQAGTGYFVGTFPTAIATPANYNLDIRQRLTGTALVSDPTLLAGVLAWNGAAEAGPATAVLAASGLNAVSVADVTSDADGRSTFPKMVRALFNRMYNNVQQTATTLTVRNDAGTTVHTMTVSDDGTTATKAKSS